MGCTVRDFWAWSLSDLRSNTARSKLAEFLVSRALDATGFPHVEWDSCDVRTTDGIAVEVKAGAYLQTWEQRTLSAVSFGGLRARTWSPQERRYTPSSTYNADVYVFALMHASDHGSYAALDVAQWSFWVLSQAHVAATGQSSLGLNRVKALAGEPIPYGLLAAGIRAAASA